MTPSTAWAPILLAMKLGVSLAKTTLLPSRLSQKSAMNESSSLSVDLPGMISRSFMCRGGLKKCVPRKCARVSFDSSSEILFTDSPDVFVLRIAPGFRCFSTCRSRSLFTWRSSTTPSMTQSASASHSRWSSKLPGVMSLASAAMNIAGGLAPWVDRIPALASLLLKSGESLVSPFLTSPASGSAGTMSSR